VTVMGRLTATTLRVLAVVVPAVLSAVRWLRRRDDILVRALVATRGRRRAVVVGVLLLTSSAWAAAAVPAPRVVAAPAPPVPPELVRPIILGRPAGYPIGGIDLSSHDHQHFPIRWEVEVAAGSQFVYVKAAEGTRYVNPHFTADYAAAKATHRYVGAYVYARPDLGDPVGQAEHFLRHAGFTGDARTLVPFVDLEWPYAGVVTGPCYNLRPDQMRAWIHAFLDRIEAGVHRKPMIYTNTHWWNPCTGDDPSFGGYPLDIASYTSTPPKLPAGWTTFALWQYRAGNPDRRGDYDRDVVNGGMAGLAALAGPHDASR
jgi:GH25 family lysozyme M1 (1,4-beta-N-acetylmuramidase)